MKKPIIKNIPVQSGRFVRQEQEILSREQRMLNEVLGGGSPQTWGTGNNLPKLHRTLTTGNGLIKSGDTGETGNLFGIRKRW